MSYVMFIIMIFGGGLPTGFEGKTEVNPSVVLSHGDLTALTANAAGELDVLGHDCHTLGVDCAQIGVFKK